MPLLRCGECPFISNASAVGGEPVIGPQRDAVIKLMAMASKLAHDVSPYLYPTQQAIKHGGEEDAAPIRIETLSDAQLEILIQRLSRG
jgi:hypothetical protein